ncbi:2-keto-4-pentenoate hydratase [Desulfoferula mesophila]|uniref:2-keto-4-pentenoate hydratase n=1 Tax=Desulfoferula mesophila TaxID=3058419 RepID=A0AAU9EYS9_9BACT|nr:2-keto-4-pentenoate hydratase [Desulfoferula mesophilus]
MSMNQKQIAQAAKSLAQAAKDRKPIAALTETYPGITVEEAYRIQTINVDARIKAGARVVGKKIGLTSPAMQQMLGVDEPDYGVLLDDMLVYQGVAFETGTLLQPRIEGEIAFVMGKDLMGPVTPAEVALAVAGVTPALEIIDSRIKDWKIKIQDTVADNASSAAIVIGASLIPLGELDLRHVGFVLTKNGRLAGTGAGAAVLGSPIQSVAWLINKMAEMGVGVKAGEIILSGAASAAVDVAPGDSIHLVVDRLGEVACCFA